MTPKEIEALFGPAPQAAAPAAPAPAPATELTPEQLFGAAPMQPAIPWSSAAPAAAPAPQTPAVTVPSPDAPGATAEVPPSTPNTEPSLGSRIASDVGTGVTELPRAIVKGARDAFQETANFARDATNWQQSLLDPILGPAPKADGVQLPDLKAPESVTGKLATSVSQFITGMVGLGKIAKPLEAAGGLAKAGRAAKIATESAKAATVGAVAFDPHGPRFADLVESVPGLSNPITSYLKADPTDSAAEGRIKNALESIGLDAVLMGSVMMSAKLYRVMRDRAAGKATQADVDRVMAEAEAQNRQAEEAVQPTGPETSGAPKAEVPGSAPEMHVAGPEGHPAQPPDGPATPAAPPSPTRDVLELGSGRAPSTRPRDVLDLSAPKADPAAPSPQAPRVEVTRDQTTGLLKSLREDADALTKADGDWNRAVDAGHVFGRGERVPWQKIRTEGPEGNGLDAFVRRLSDETEAQLNAQRGGDAAGVLSDARVQSMVTQSAKLFGDDPALVTGRLAMAGEASRRLAVDLEVSYLAANRALQDAYALAARIKAGDLTEFAGSAEAAAEALRHQLADASTLYGYGQAIRAGAGRTMRRMREEFGPKQADIEAMRGLSPDKLVDAVVQTGGNPQAIQKLTSRSALRMLGDALEFSYVNGLLWGPRSHFVNFATNAYMVGFRPLERIIGGGIIGAARAGKDLITGSQHGASEGLTAAQQAFHQGIREYTYIGASLSNAWRMAAETWQRGDSMLSPHSLESLTAPRINPAALRFKTPDNLPAVLHNAVTALVKVTGFPTRALGTVDELVQQTVYRSQVQAKAHSEGIRAGLTGPELEAHVRQRLDAAFDADLRATDAAALQEARTSTFQQDLLPGTLGHTIASAAVKHQLVRFVLPFVRTPTNVLRYGTKLTPGLNLLQAEYRQMLSGKMGAEMQAQAVGQMSLGSLFLGLAAYYASSGAITGAGPSDPKLRSALMATGWQPYSVVKVNADGTRSYINYGRYDPVGLPFGIVADVVDAISASDDSAGPSHQVWDALVGATLGLAKQLSNKSYLKSINDAVEAFSDPDRSGEKFGGQLASNLIPFSSALRFANPDPHLRDARSMADKMLATVPGLSATLPPRRDAFGDPITLHKGLWVTDQGSLVDAEVRRMALESDFVVGPPSTTVGGVDLRDITMVNGRNAYDQYQEWAAKPSKNGPSIKQTIGRIMQSPAYQRAPDGDAATRGTKMAMLAGTFAKYRAAAAQRLRTDKNVREAMAKKTRDVAAAYAASKAPKNPQAQGRESIGAIGQAFGVDLQGLMQ